MNGWEPITEVAVTPAERLEASEKFNLEVATKPKRVKVKLLDDPVNSPSHYTAGGIETIDYIKAKLTPEEYIGYLKGSVIKYTSRAGKKIDTIQDLEKAQWYMNRQIKELKGEAK
jgi:hypothetical protein